MLSLSVWYTISLINYHKGAWDIYLWCRTPTQSYRLCQGTHSIKIWNITSIKTHKLLKCKLLFLTQIIHNGVWFFSGFPFLSKPIYNNTVSIMMKEMKRLKKYILKRILKRNSPKMAIRDEACKGCFFTSFFFNLFISRTISVTASFAFLLTNHRKFSHRTSFCIVWPKGLSF